MTGASGTSITSITRGNNTLLQRSIFSPFFRPEVEMGPFPPPSLVAGGDRCAPQKSAAGRVAMAHRCGMREKLRGRSQ